MLTACFCGGDNMTIIRLGLAGTIIAGLCAATAMAQARSSKNLSAPGTLREVGGSGSSNDFSRYSYGLGTASPGSGGSSDPLRSTIGTVADPGNYRPGQPSAGITTDMSSAVGPLSSFGQTSAKGMGDLVTDTGESSLIRTLLSKEATIGMGGFYTSQLLTHDGDFSKRDKPITTLVPERASPYRSLMAEGESHMASGNFHDAFNSFRQANITDAKDWPSLVSMFHAKFATATGTYFSSSYYLKRAIRNYPELAGTPLQPRELFGEKNRAKLAEVLTELDRHLVESPFDSNASLMLAYFMWFDGQAEQSKDALVKAYASATTSKDSDMIQAIEAFWNSMVATGKVTGSLDDKPAARKAPSAKTVTAATAPVER